MQTIRDLEAAAIELARMPAVDGKVSRSADNQFSRIGMGDIADTQVRQAEGSAAENLELLRDQDAMKLFSRVGPMVSV